jgi:hypothetical protein
MPDWRDWHRLRDWDIDLGAFVEPVRNGFIVSIRVMRDGVPEQIVGSERAAVGEGKTVDVAFRRAMDTAESELALGWLAEHGRSQGRRPRRRS